MISRTAQKGRGFTVIEVMIVLTIAGLILLIVFLAVPALKRNSRNTDRKRDVGIYLAAVREWSASHRERLPSVDTDLTDPDDGVNILAKMTSYQPPLSVVTGGDGFPLTLDRIRYVYQGECNLPDNGNTHAGKTYQFALRYGLEAGNGSVIERCSDF